MAEERAKRKLSAILSADVKGYSRLMGEDELATIETLKNYREIMAALIDKFEGRVVDSPGDNVLAEFSSVVDVLECSVEIQKELKRKNDQLPENRRMEFRIGVNLGDVVEDGERIYGDGVNIAARVESLAEGGGICISGTAFDQIGKKLPLGYKYLGEQTVKNIEKPVRVYRILVEPEAVGRVIGQERPRPRRYAVMAAVVILVLGAAALTVWNFYFRAPRIEPASVEKMAFPLPDKPSIAILPFANIGGDPGQDYFSDGLTEEIITALSKVPRLFVIASNSTFSYKGKPVKVHQVAEELGVRYVLEGSVRKAGDRVRITAQLIDALKGHHLWAERYERDLKDIFAVQDEITMKIITELQVKLTEGEQTRLVAKGTENLQAYLKYWQAVGHIMTQTKEGNALARPLFEEAIALDPNYAPAYSALGSTYYLDVLYRTSKSPKESLAKAMKLTQKAIALDESYPQAHTQLGWLYIMMARKHEKGIAECERAVALDPNGASAHMWMGMVLRYAGRHEEALRFAEQALRLNPNPPGVYLRQLGWAYLHNGRYDEAISALKKALNRTPKDIFTTVVLTAAYSQAGREDEARTEAAEVLKISPKFSLQGYAKRLAYKNQGDRELMVEALRKAGLPETPPLPLPDKPSIAVLPFTNIGDDPKQEYFADGMTEDLITDLSKMLGVFVIARNSVFQYKGKAVHVKKVSRELGVRYLLEGSVRRADDKVRINAQLIDATTGGHLWAERYDGKMGDVFGLQDKITEKIVASLAVELTSDEKENIARRGTDNVAAYDAFVQGREYLLRHTRDDMVKALTSLKKAIELDPNFSNAHADLSLVYTVSRARRWDEDLGWTDTRALAKKHLQLAMKNPTPKVHRAAAWHYIWKGQHEKAIAEAERSLTLEPNNALSHHTMGGALIYAGRSKEAIDFYKKAMRLDPFYPARYLWFLGLAQFCVGQLEEAATSFERARKRNPGGSAWPLAAAYAHLGRKQEAKDVVADYLKKRRMSKPPTVKFVLKYFPFKDPKDTDRFAEGLRKAGFE